MDATRDNANNATGSPPQLPSWQWRRHAGWLLMGLLLILEYGLFRQYAEREIVWGYPIAYDQTMYLAQSYTTFEHILRAGLHQGLVFGLERPIPNGMMLHVQAALLYPFLGPSRLSALTLNFLYFALLQCVLVATVRWYSGRWSLAFLALGLLLAVRTPFFYAGGLMDFRIDFIAYCLFGVFLCVVMRSGLFASWKWSMAAGAAGGLLVLFRYLTAVYLAGMLGSYFLLLCVGLYRQRRDSTLRHALRRRLGGMVIAGVVLLLLAGPAVWHNRATIRAYYLPQLKNGDAKERALEQNIHDTAERLLFYPRSVLKDHAGIRFWKLTMLATATALVAGLFRPWSKATPIVAVEPGAQSAAGFLVLSALVPILILTRFDAPSPVVGGIVVPALVWLAVLFAVALARVARPSPAGRVQTAWGVALAVVVLAVGFGSYADELSRRGPLSAARDDTEQVTQLYDEIARHSKLCGWTAPMIARNDIRDSINGMAGLVVLYEQNRTFLAPRDCLCGIAAVTEEQALAGLGQSDFAIMNAGPLPENADRPPPRYEFPFVKSMRSIRPQLLAACERDFIRLRTFHLFGDEVILYARPQAQVTGQTTDNWVPASGLLLTAFRADLRRFPRMDIRGDIDLALLKKVPGVRAALQIPGQSERQVPATIAVDGRRYLITVDLKDEELPEQPSLVVHLTFDTTFCPRECYPNNDDPRHLVMRPPDHLQLLASP
jgi:hypothetical protein